MANGAEGRATRRDDDEGDGTLERRGEATPAHPDGESELYDDPRRQPATMLDTTGRSVSQDIPSPNDDPPDNADDEFTTSGIINCETVEEADYVIMGLDYDVTSSGGKGADEGPAAIAEVLNRQIEPYNAVLGREPCKHAKIAYNFAGKLNELTPTQMVQKVAAGCSELIMRNQTVFHVGGDHSVSIPIFMAHADILGPDGLKDITVIHVDAHLDLRDEDEFRVNPYGEYAHCCVMRRAYEYGFYNWVQVGQRSYSQEEMDFAKEHDFTVFTDDHTERLPTDPSVIARAVKTKKVAIEIDADGICPGDMPGTGTPVGGGPSLSYIRELLKLICLKHEVVWMGMTEVAPSLDPTGVTVYNAGQLIYDVLGYSIARRNRFRPKPQAKKKVPSKSRKRI